MEFSYHCSHNILEWLKFFLKLILHIIVFQTLSFYLLKFFHYRKPYEFPVGVLDSASTIFSSESLKIKK